MKRGLLQSKKAYGMGCISETEAGEVSQHHLPFFSEDPEG
jgi:hypothetical protein